MAEVIRAPKGRVWFIYRRKKGDGIIINWLISFVQANWMDILTVVCFIIFCLALVRLGKTATVKKMVGYLVVKAEQELGSKTGALKYQAVCTWLYERMPFILKLLFTQKQLQEYIEAAVLALKARLDSGMTLLSLAEEANLKKCDTDPPTKPK